MTSIQPFQRDCAVLYRRLRRKVITFRDDLPDRFFSACRQDYGKSQYAIRSTSTVKLGVAPELTKTPNMPSA